MKYFLSFLLFFFLFAVQAQDDQYVKEIEKYRKEQDAEFSDPKTSPLAADERKSFQGHEYFPVDANYKVQARFEATPKSSPFTLGTNTGGAQLFRRIGILHFELWGEPYTLEAYLKVQSFAMRSTVNYVFLPVIDLTTGETTYGAGRYLQYEGIPEGEEWIIDFNKLYNPYCAYNANYECPLVPESNHLPVKIEAGVKDYSPNKK